MQTFPLNNVEYNAEDMGAYFSTRVRGVYSSDTDFRVTGTTPGTISVSPGRAWLSPTEFFGVLAWEETATPGSALTGSGFPPTVASRRVSIVLRYTKANNSTELVTVSPSDGDVSVHVPVHTEDIEELTIASVFYNFAGGFAISDHRADPTYCGVMRDGVTGIPTEGLLEQAHRDFQDAIDDLTALASDSATAAEASANTATLAASAASNSETQSQSWAVGGTGSRPGEDTNNAKYWSEQAENAAGGGVASFNGRSGIVVPQAGDYTAEMVGAMPAGSSSGPELVYDGILRNTSQLSLTGNATTMVVISQDIGSWSNGVTISASTATAGFRISFASSGTYVIELSATINMTDGSTAGVKEGGFYSGTLISPIAVALGYQTGAANARTNFSAPPVVLMTSSSSVTYFPMVRGASGDAIVSRGYVAHIKIYKVG